MQIPLLAKGGAVVAVFAVLRGWPCLKAAFFTAPKKIRELKNSGDGQSEEQWEAYRKKMNDRFWWFVLAFMLACIVIGLAYLSAWLQVLSGTHSS